MLDVHSILTDRGTNFMSELFKNVCKIFNIKKYSTSAYRPESNGALERAHGTIKAYLRLLGNSNNLADWEKLLPFAVFSYNTQIHSATGYSPYELIYGRKAQLPVCGTLNNVSQYTFDDYSIYLKQLLQNAREIANKNLMESKELTKLRFDKTTNNLALAVGDLVVVQAIHTGKGQKLQNTHDGPFTVLEIVSEQNVKINKGKKPYLIHKNRLLKFFE